MLVINLLMNISNSTFPADLNSSREISHKELNRDYNYFIEDYDYGYIIALIGNGYTQPLPFFRMVIFKEIYGAYKVSSISDVRHDEAYFKNRKNWSGFAIQGTFDPNFMVQYSAKFFEIVSKQASNRNLS